jgi:hypothetical protein
MNRIVGTTHLLLRTREVSPAILALADHLEAISGHAVSLVYDASRGDARCESHSVINLSVAACSELGLYCPPGFAWQCGDYGYYLARRRFPNVELFWLIETDVGFYGEDPGYFFRFFAEQREVDFLAGRLGPAEQSWFWRNTARARDVSPFQCLFPVTRLSRRAIDAAFARRIEQGRHLSRRILWPNDEAFVATTLMNGAFVTRDVNDFGPAFYHNATFYYGAPMNGDGLQLSPATVHVVHPVLSGSEHAAKLRALKQRSAARESWITQNLRWAARKMNVLSRW